MSPVDQLCYVLSLIWVRGECNDPVPVNCHICPLSVLMALFSSLSMVTLEDTSRNKANVSNNTTLNTWNTIKVSL